MIHYYPLVYYLQRIRIFQHYLIIHHQEILYPVKIGLLNVFFSQRKIFLFQFSLIGLGLEQNDAKMLIIGHSEKNINDRLSSLRYARVRRGKQNPVKAFFTYGLVPNNSLNPWYPIPNGYDIKQIYPNGLITKANVVFPSWFRLVRLKNILIYMP